MKAFQKTLLLLFLSIFISLGFPSCSFGSHSSFKFTRVQTHRAHYNRRHRKYVKNRTAYHSKPVQKDYIINHKRKARGW